MLRTTLTALAAGVWLLTALGGSAAAGAKTIPVKTTISIRAPRWAPGGQAGVTFEGTVSAGPGCTVGRRVGLYQDGYGQLAGFVRTDRSGRWRITVDVPGRRFTRFHAAAIFEYRSPSYAKPNRLACDYAITPPLPPRW